MGSAEHTQDPQNRQGSSLGRCITLLWLFNTIPTSNRDKILSNSCQVTFVWGYRTFFCGFTSTTGERVPLAFIPPIHSPIRVLKVNRGMAMPVVSRQHWHLLWILARQCTQHLAGYFLDYLKQPKSHCASFPPHTPHVHPHNSFLVTSFSWI